MGQKASSAKECIKTQRLGGRRGRRFLVREHRAPKGALRLVKSGVAASLSTDGQKAPSAKRCIKTVDQRQMAEPGSQPVRKHRAPKGALRPVQDLHLRCGLVTCQKAPSAKRCIKTSERGVLSPRSPGSQKAPSAKRCIKTFRCGHRARLRGWRSESTERQKVH